MKRWPLILLLVGACGFAAGLWHLFQLRFSAGDIYPAYSSLRADPLGTKALFDSLARLILVRRSYQPLQKLSDGRAGTLFYLGVNHEDLEVAPEEMKSLQGFVDSGGRLVISLYPSFQAGPRVARALRPPMTTTNAPSSKQRAKKNPRDPGRDPSVPRTVSLAEEWGFQCQHRTLLKNAEGDHASTVAILDADAPADLPDLISCHTALVFEKLAPPWRRIYSRTNDQVVLMERSLGDGSIVLAADSYLLSNEALLNERQPALLAWLLGQSQRAVFDETHLGVLENTGVVTLLRKYRLHGFFAGLFLLTGLFVWKNSSSLVPPHEQTKRAAESVSIHGKESSAGFVNLLRRNISAGNILAVCLGEWKKSSSRGYGLARVQKVEAIIQQENQRPVKDRNQVEIYRRISEILSRKI